MKKQTNLNLAKISKEELKEVTNPVKEIVAKNFVHYKSLTVVDLWNIHRLGKTAMNSRKIATFL